MHTPLDTVVTIPVVAFDDDGAIDAAATGGVIDRMISNGISAITANGNTGEFYSLRPEERRSVIRLNAEFSDRAVVIAGIGLDVTTARADGEFAIASGCRHLMIHQPPHPFVSPEGWLEYNAEIADAFEATTIIPYIKSPNIPTDTVLQLIDRCPNVGAVKFAVESPNAYARLVARAPRPVEWICGVAELWAPAFHSTSGRAAFTSGLADVAPRLSLALHRALSGDDRAAIQELWNLIQPFEELRSQQASKNNVSVVKEALAQLGLIKQAVRPPISRVDQDTSRAVAEFLDTASSAGHLDPPVPAAPTAPRGTPTNC